LSRRLASSWLTENQELRGAKKGREMSDHSVLYGLVIFLGITFMVSDILLSRAVFKSGLPRWWAWLFLVPGLNVLMLWMFACGKGPSLSEQQ
jgi:hypothetical protein